LKHVEICDEEYRYPVTERTPQPRCDSHLPRHEQERRCRANSTRKYAGPRCTVAVGPVGRPRTGKRATQRIAPRLVYKKEAAFYCGIGVESFAANCPVAPVRVGPGMRGLRYDLYDLDVWIDSLKQSSMNAESNENWLDRVGNDESAD
jgi:hypothetical protein